MLLKGEDIQLRALEPNDLELLYTWENNSEVWNVSQTLVPFSKFVLHQYLENQHLDIFATKQLRLVIVNSNNVSVGLIDLFEFDPQNSRAGIGILIADEKNRGKGYSKSALKIFLNYAFNHLGLHQVYANVGSQNTASITLFSGLGFKEAGVKKDWIKNGISFHDEILFQCIR
jgi:diamine N-acetyltransferase